MLELHRKTKV